MADKQVISTTIHHARQGNDQPWCCGCLYAVKETHPTRPEIAVWVFKCNECGVEVGRGTDGDVDGRLAYNPGYDHAMKKIHCEVGDG